MQYWTGVYVCCIVKLKKHGGKTDRMVRADIKQCLSSSEVCGSTKHGYYLNVNDDEIM